MTAPQKKASPLRTARTMLWALLGHVALIGSSSFQYVVTTSTEPAEALKPFERLRLSSASEDGLLLRRRVGAEQRPLA